MIYSRAFYDSHPPYYEEGNCWNEPAPPIAWDSADENAYVPSEPHQKAKKKKLEGVNGSAVTTSCRPGADHYHIGLLTP